MPSFIFCYIGVREAAILWAMMWLSSQRDSPTAGGRHQYTGSYFKEDIFMLQRKFVITINENLKRDDAVGSVVSMSIGCPEGGNKVLEYKSENAELTEEQIVEAVNKLMHYFLPEVPAEDVETPKTVAVFKPGPDGELVRI